MTTQRATLLLTTLLTIIAACGGSEPGGTYEGGSESEAEAEGEEGEAESEGEGESEAEAEGESEGEIVFCRNFEDLFEGSWTGAIVLDECPDCCWYDPGQMKEDYWRLSIVVTDQPPFVWASPTDVTSLLTATLEVGTWYDNNPVGAFDCEVYARCAEVGCGCATWDQDCLESCEDTCDCLPDDQDCLESCMDATYDTLLLGYSCEGQIIDSSDFSFEAGMAFTEGRGQDSRYSMHGYGSSICTVPSESGANYTSGVERK